MNTRDAILIVLGAALLVGGWLAWQTLSPHPAAGPSAAVAVAALPDDSAAAFHEAFFQALINRSPEWSSSLRLFGTGTDPLGDRLDDISIARQRDDLAYARAGLAKLRAFDATDLDEDERLANDILTWFLDDIARGEPFLFHTYLVHQLFSVPNQLFQFMLSTHPIQSRTDAEQYVARLNAASVKFDQLIEYLHRQEALGILAPKFILEQVLQGLGPGGGDPTRHVFVTSLVERLAGVPDLSEAERTALAAAAAEAVRTSVQPAYARLREVVARQVTLATDEAGVWKLPNGDAYYAQMLRHHTTTDLTPQAIHDLGLYEVERIQGELRALFGELGLDAADPVFGNAMRSYWGQTRGLPEMTYPDTEAGHAQAVADYTAIVREVEAQIGDLFDVLPSAPVEVHAMPPERAGSPAHYEPPSFDGSRPGVFYANVSPPPYKPGMRTLTFHEAVPGHHFHLALQGESDLPLHQKVLVFTAHVEGWALYAEKLMREAGMYPDVHSQIENLWSELFRAGRLVVDTGIHYKRWTRQEALDYFNDNLGTPIASEIDRYIIWPGQATAYKVGELKILELRQRALDALGEAFDIKQFHNVMLQSGNMPLNLLQQQVERTIAQEKAKLD